MNEPTIPATMSAEAALQQAVAHHQAGRLREAEPLYRAVLQAWPKHPDANHNLGVLAMQSNQPAVAVPHLKAALDANPAQGQYWLSYIAALIQAGQSDAARQILAQGRQRGLQGEAAEKLAARLGSPQVGSPQGNLPSAARQRKANTAPTTAEISHGMALFNQGRYVELEPMARALTVRFPRHGFSWQLLGAVLKQMGRVEEALAPMQKAAALLPGDAEAHYNLGLTLKNLRRLEEAESSYRRALEIQPDFAEAHGNLGVTLQEQGRQLEAEASFRRAVEVKPDFANAHNNLGTILQAQGRLPDAEASYRRALEIKPDYAEAHSNLSGVLIEQDRPSEAEASCRRALEIRLDFAEAHGNLGNTLRDQGRLAEAVESYRKAFLFNPDFEDAFGSMLFTLNYHPDQSAEEIFAAYREYDERFGLPHRGAWRAHANNRETGRRLKVGYVSPDFNTHAVRYFLEPLLARHDKGELEVYAYAELKREDAVTARYQSCVEHWIPTRGLSDEALAERIRADGIDILVDLAGHTTGNRLGVFARKPTPVSVSWLGYGYTTGLTAIDYLLTDETSAPPGSEGLFSERPWRLATPGYVFRPAEGMGGVSPLPASERGHVTFGTLTRAVRINHHTIRVWSEILKRVEGARLVIDSRNFQDAAMRESLAEKFAAHGISRERLEIGFHSPPWDVLRGMDIGLDCFPHNSGTTLFETLYLGVPYVTLAGRPSVGRLGSSVLEGAGHPEWIARTEEEYVEKAVALAGDLPRLAAIRAGLRAQMEAGALRDEAGFARKVEAAYREMFERWASNPVGQ